MKKRIEKAAKSIVKMYGEIKELPFNETEKSIRMQGYRDSLEAMKRNGLIVDYNLRLLTITM